MEADKNIRHGDCASHQPENDEGPQRLQPILLPEASHP